MTNEDTVRVKMGFSKEKEVLFNQLPGCGGDIGEIVLNRPQALNALTRTMCENIRHQLGLWAEDSGIKAVIIRGAGDRAFCAGGDLKSLYYLRGDFEAGVDFFRAEYQMNRAVYHFPKPYIAFMDGVTMGGGAGLSIHGSHRVATEHLRFAMPETGIGFFCDAGSGYFLNKCPGYAGYYLGLTGEIMGLADALLLNLVHYGVARANIPAVIQALCEMPFESSDVNAVSRVIQRFAEAPGTSALPVIGDVMNDCFSRHTIEEIFDALEVVASPWADRTLRTLTKRSPTSLKVTLRYLRETQGQLFDAVMNYDFNIACALITHPDFYEGIRAVLIDKGDTPHFDPDKITAVSERHLTRFFHHTMFL